MVGDQAINFFRDALVETAHTSLDMGNRYVEFGCGQSACQGAIGVAIYQDLFWFEIGEQRFQGRKHARGLYRVSAGADAEMMVRLRQCKLGKEHVGHSGVVMLARVDQYLVDVRMFLHLFRNERSLDELRAGTDDRRYSHVNAASTMRPPTRRLD